MSVFQKLNDIDFKKHIEKKKDLSYLSWPWAWGECLKEYPESNYSVIKFDGKPYIESDLGYMVFTNVTIEGQIKEMWLPVMDGANKAMKKEAYSYKTKYGEKWVQAVSMFDINKTLMRCLVKNLAMFGLGLYIYAGEDLPEILQDDNNSHNQQNNAPQQQANQDNIKPQPPVTTGTATEQEAIDFIKNQTWPEAKKEAMIKNAGDPFFRANLMNEKIK